MNRSLRSDARWSINRERSDLLIREAARKIKNMLDASHYLQPRMAVLITGSIARREAGTYSEIGIMVLHKKIDEAQVRTMVEELRRIALGSTGTTHMVKAVSAIDISGKMPQPIFYIDIMGELGYQNILEGAKVYGSDAILAGAKMMIANDWTVPSVNARISGGLKSHTRALVSQMETGKRKVDGATIVDYDLQTGVCSYAPGYANAPKSFKAPVLAVHSWLIQNLAFLALRSPEYAANIITPMPSNTVDKLDYLVSSGRVSIPAGAIADLADSYLFFLKKFQLSQHEASEGHRHVLFSANEAMERISSLARILKGPLF